MAMDQLVIGWGWIIEHSKIITILFYSSFQLSMITWFAIICYKWEIDEIRKNIIVNIGEPLSDNNGQPNRENGNIYSHERDEISPKFGMNFK